MASRVAVLAVALLAACSAKKPAPAAAAAPAPLGRVAVIGASVSAGYKSPTVAQVLDESIQGAHAVLDVAEVSLFRDPVKRGGAQIDAALAFRPTLVVGIDFLFWYAYGGGMTRADRMSRLDVGLAALERLGDLPLLVGDVPDMSGAREDMLPPSAVPSPEDLAALNARIHAWARGRASVRVLPLDALISEVLGKNGPEGVMHPEKLMAPDRLHPTRHGLIYLLGFVVRELESAYPDTRGAIELPPWGD